MQVKPGTSAMHGMLGFEKVTVPARYHKSRATDTGTRSFDLLFLLGHLREPPIGLWEIPLRSGLACLTWAPSVRYRLLTLGTAHEVSIQLH